MMIKELNHRVVEYTSYENKIVHIENISYDMALVLTDIMNERLDSYFTVEEMDNETKED